MASRIVTITSSAPAEVISERIVDGGRERYENGRDELAPGTPQDFIVHEGQSVRVLALPDVLEQDAATTATSGDAA